MPERGAEPQSQSTISAAFLKGSEGLRVEVTEPHGLLGVESVEPGVDLAETVFVGSRQGKVWRVSAK